MTTPAHRIACNVQFGLRGARSSIARLPDRDRPTFTDWRGGRRYGFLPRGGAGDKPEAGAAALSLFCRLRLPPGCISKQVHSSTLLAATPPPSPREAERAAAE